MDLGKQILLATHPLRCMQTELSDELGSITSTSIIFQPFNLSYPSTFGQLCDAAMLANLSRPRSRKNSIVANSANFLPLRKNM